MRKLKRTISTMLITVMLCACFSISAFAASAELRFSDPQTTVGAEVKITATFSCDSSIESMSATLSYDPSMLRFVEGGNAQVSNGIIKYTGAGDGTSTKLTHEFTFQALAEGTTKIEVEDSEGESTYGSSMSVTNGSSTITIGPGDPSLIEDDATATGGVQIEVDGKQYLVSGDFSEALVPTGFVESETQFEGVACRVVMQESSGTVAMYLVGVEDNEGDFFLYDSTNGQFSPFESVEIAPGRNLVFLQNDGTVSVPAGYSETTITMEGSGKEFSAWQNTDNTEYYLVYGLNSDGTKALYMYDTVDGTYQRYLQGSAVAAVEEKVSDNALVKFAGENLALTLIFLAAAILLLLLLLIVVAIKLRHRNIELDDLYDEYDIDLDDDDSDDYSDDYDDYDEDDYEDDDLFGLDDDFEDDDIDDWDEFFDAYAGKPSSRKQMQPAAKKTKSAYSHKDERTAASLRNERQTSSRQGGRPAVRPAAPRPVSPTIERPASRRGHMEMDDTFKMDIIDLD